MSRKALLLAGLVAVAQVSCGQAILVAPAGTTGLLFANPLFIPAAGGVSVVTAVLTEPAGTPVPDGTVVQFFTTLGRIDEQGKTNDGVARVNLVSDSRSGTATVTAISGGASFGAAVEVRIGSVLPAAVFVRADPPRITDSRSTRVFAIVVDDNGNPVANVPVSFSVNTSSEFMDSAGAPRFTDTNGQAEDVMRTRRTTSGIATVTATVLTGSPFSESVEVPIVFGPS
jgi:hypothetical protein